jgi:hypothetical protein
MREVRFEAGRQDIPRENRCNNEVAKALQGGRLDAHKFHYA